MRPVVVSLTGSGSGTTNSTPIPMNWRGSPFNVGLAFTTDGSTTGFTVQASYDNQNDYASAATYNSTATWFDIPGLNNLKADTDGSLNNPVRAVRLQANATGTDTGTLTIIQSGTK